MCEMKWCYFENQSYEPFCCGAVLHVPRDPAGMSAVTLVVVPGGACGVCHMVVHMVCTHGCIHGVFSKVIGPGPKVSGPKVSGRADLTGWPDWPDWLA